jgi:hypothetical protein
MVPGRPDSEYWTMSLYRQLNHVAWILRIRPDADRLRLWTAVPRVRVGVPMASRVRLPSDSVEYQIAAPPSALGDQMSMPWRASTRDELVRQLEKTGAFPLWPLALIGVVVLGSITPWLALVGVPALVWLAWRDKIRRTVLLFYEIDEPVRSVYERLYECFTYHATGSDRAYARKTPSSSRQPLSRTTSGPAHLSASVEIPSLMSSALSVFLLPDMVLVREGGRYLVARYQDLTISHREELLTEPGPRPRDAVQPLLRSRHDDVTHERPAENEARYGCLSLAGARFEVIWAFSREHAHVQLARGIEEMRNYWLNRGGGRRGP